MRMRTWAAAAAVVLAAVAAAVGLSLPAAAPPLVVHDVYTVYQDVITYDVESIFDVTCLVGDKVIGGGYDIPVATSMQVFFNRPPDVAGVPSATTWRIGVRLNTGYSLRVVATCADL